MRETPGAGSLPGVTIEKSAIAAAVGGSASIATLEQPDAAEVIDRIQQCDIAHFACHGVSNPAEPSESGLLLQTRTSSTAEPRLDILTVRKIYQVHVSHGEIAFLSACSTAENHAVKLVDEVLHIVSGFQVAGFRHVVGYMRPSSDMMCAWFARSFYSELCGNSAMDYEDRAVALALHKAFVEVYERDEYRERPLEWLHCVHYGA
jgi:CHAT domain-containing protein